MDLQLTNSADQQMVAQLQQLSNVMLQAQTELASGKKVNQASDAPGDVQAILRTQSDLARVQQSQTNLNTLNSEVTMAGSVLESAAKLMDQARSIAAQTPSARWRVPR